MVRRVLRAGPATFTIEHLRYHEVGHHVDWYRRHWSKANLREVEEAADQYAVRFAKTATHVFNRLQKARAEVLGVQLAFGSFRKILGRQRDRSWGPLTASICRAARREQAPLFGRT